MKLYVKTGSVGVKALAFLLVVLLLTTAGLLLYDRSRAEAPQTPPSGTSLQASTPTSPLATQAPLTPSEPTPTTAATVPATAPEAPPVTEDRSATFRAEVLAFVARKTAYRSYCEQTSGVTEALGGLYRQQVGNLEYVKDGDFYAVATASGMVSVKHRAAGRATLSALAFSDKDKTPQRQDVATYRESYGLLPTDPLLAGFLVNEATLTDVALLSEQDGCRRYRLTLDPEAAAVHCKVRMKTFGGLSGLPVFSSLSMTLTLDGEGMPTALTVDSEYRIRIPILGKQNCKQTLTVTYTAINTLDALPADAADLFAALAE